MSMKFITHLQSIKILTNTNRSTVIDFYRGLAILAAVAFHYNHALPMGYLGVDLFFVISGYLVGGILINYFNAGNVPFWKFVLQRGLKIGPSYFFF
jgi:peptidoglycan/LPS O-acetylase OafA/YrhL